MASTETAGTTIYRLEIPAEIASELTRLALESERTLPAQVRWVLRDWLKSRSA